MQKILIGIFAHPDDEGFGPSGSLYKAAQGGTDVHLLLATKGDAGTNIHGAEDLGEVRLKEWRESGTLIGAKSMHCFAYQDGSLSNNVYLELAHKITEKIREVLLAYSEPAKLELLTFDQNGLSGHLDHIAVSMITTYVYNRLAEVLPKNVALGKLRYFCIPRVLAPEPNTEWIFMPAGRSEEEIDEKIDIEDLYEHKLAIMRAHHSQRADMEMILGQYGNNPARFIECFVHYKS